MRSKLVILFVFFFWSQLTFSQHIEHVKTIELDFTVSAVSSDHLGNLYLGSSNGEIIVYDSTGALSKSFFLSNQGSIHSITAWNPLRIFAFSRDMQSFWFLERFAADPRSYDANTLSRSFLLEMTPGQDHSFWLLESNGNNLKKINESTRSSMVNVPLINLGISTPVQFVSYKNVLVILDENSLVSVIDAFGNILYQIPDQQIQSIQLWENRLLYALKNEIHTVDMYKKTPGNVITFPGDIKKFQRISNKLFYQIETKKIKLFRYIDR